MKTRIEDLDMNPHSYTHLFLTKLPKTYDGAKTASSIKVAGKSSYLPEEN
jgi:hypothetical protein